jgi:hypothetical protein
MRGMNAPVVAADSASESSDLRIAGLMRHARSIGWPDRFTYRGADSLAL